MSRSVSTAQHPYPDCEKEKEKVKSEKTNLLFARIFAHPTTKRRTARS